MSELSTKITLEMNRILFAVERYVTSWNTSAGNIRRTSDENTRKNAECDVKSEVEIERERGLLILGFSGETWRKANWKTSQTGHDAMTNGSLPRTVPDGLRYRSRRGGWRSHPPTRSTPQIKQPWQRYNAQYQKKTPFISTCSLIWALVSEVG